MQSPSTNGTQTKEDFRALAVELIHEAMVTQTRSGENLQRAVDVARHAGLTWKDIGQALGTTRQAAQGRFGGSDDAAD